MRCGWGGRHWWLAAGPLTVAVLVCRRRGWPPRAWDRCGGLLMARLGPVVLAWWRGR